MISRKARSMPIDDAPALHYTEHRKIIDTAVLLEADSRSKAKAPSSLVNKREEGALAIGGDGGI